MTAVERQPVDGPDLPAGHRTYLHIGMFKTGTSFLQTALKRNHERLREEGVYYPLVDDKVSAQVLAARDVSGRANDKSDQAWSRLVDTIHRADAPSALVSSEWLSNTPSDRIAEHVTALAPSEVHLIITARDLMRVLPSDWQSKVKQGRIWSFEEYVASVRSDEPTRPHAHEIFWNHHDAVALARRWMQVVPHDRVHLVVVPPAGAPPALLWDRFCQVIGVTPSRYDVSLDADSNISLTYSETEFLRQINAVVRPVMRVPVRRRWVTNYLANSVLRGLPSPEDRADRPQLDPETYEWVVGRARELVAGLRELDLDVVGDLEELVPPPFEPLAGAPTGPRVPFPTRAADIVGILLRRLADVSDQVEHPEAAHGEVDGAERAAHQAARRERRKARGIA